MTLRVVEGRPATFPSCSLAGFILEQEGALSLDPEELTVFEISSVILALLYNFPPVKIFCANLHSLQPLVSPMTFLHPNIKKDRSPISP